MINNKRWEPCTERWRKIKNSVLFYWHHFLCMNCQSQGLVWKEFEARNWLENHFRRVSSAGLRWGEKEWTTNPCEVVVCVFSLKAINISSNFGILLPRITRLHYSAFHNFWNLEQFINAGLGLVLKYVYHDCIAFEGKGCVNGFVSWRMHIYIFLLWHQWKPNNWFQLFFAGPNLQAEKRNLLLVMLMMSG